MQLIRIVLLFLVGLSGSEGILGKKCAWLLLSVRKFGLHPLMHTYLKFNLAQNIVVFQRLAGMDNELPYRGHTLSDGSTITVSLQLGHLMGWTFTIMSQNTPTFSRG